MKLRQWKISDQSRYLSTFRLNQVAHISFAPFALPFECGDPAPIHHILLYVKVSDAARVETLLWL